MLSAAAFNAFLKTLEEPPAHAVFILATTEKHKIIPTILSRCQIFDFNRIKVEDGVEYMKYIASQEGVTFDDESLNLIARKADGGMRDALSMFDKAVSFCGSNLSYKQVTRSLNILDYDTYFDAVGTFLSGDYCSALMLFDSVLGQGFSGQIFMSGLCSHMRDLLVCKNPQTESLLDVTGSLLGKYKQQAAECGTEFLFESINLLTQLDTQIKTSSNQRLLVELGLMKLCGLGQKKNSEAELSQPSLPPLRKAETQSSSPAAAPKQAETPTPAPANVRTQAPDPAPQGRISLSGKPLSEIMEGALHPAERQTRTQTVRTVIDSGAQAKIEAGRQEFIDRLKAERPRFGVAFESMEIEDGAITVKVPSADLKDEILRAHTDIVQILNRSTGIEGGIKLNVLVDESQKTARILKPEEKLIYFTKRNPQFTEFRRMLDLDAE